MRKPYQRRGLNWKNIEVRRAYKNEWQTALRHGSKPFGIPIGQRYRQIVEMILGQAR